MIEMTFFEFHEHNYKNDRFCLYIMKNSHGGILYIGISTNDVWERWFGWGGHVTWDGNVIYGESSVGDKIENHLPDSLRWKIQLWTLEDCQIYCRQLPSNDDYSQAVRDIEPTMIKKLSPVLNRTYNQRPGKDTTLKSKKEIEWERYVDNAYNEIFNKEQQ